MTRLEGLLREWGEHVLRYLDYADEYGENILYEAGLLQGKVDGGVFGAKILCPEMPVRLRKIDQLVKRLPNHQMKCVRMWYCAPTKDDGKVYTKRELAGILGMSKYKFDENLRNGRRKLRIFLD